MKVLIVDDSTATRFLIAKMLRGLGITNIVEADDGAKALKVLSENPDIEFALVDWNMPVMNGFELVKAVRSQPAFDSMKIMMVTTETEMSNVVQALEAGANEYLMKPFDQEIMSGKIKMLGVLPM
jgi:two-component system chemotaxis response regulator CheY